MLYRRGENQRSQVSRRGFRRQAFFPFFELRISHHISLLRPLHWLGLPRHIIIIISAAFRSGALPSDSELLVTLIRASANLKLPIENLVEYLMENLKAEPPDDILLLAFERSPKTDIVKRKCVPVVCYFIASDYRPLTVEYARFIISTNFLSSKYFKLMKTPPESVYLAMFEDMMKAGWYPEARLVIDQAFSKGLKLDFEALNQQWLAAVSAKQDTTTHTQT
jgi:hypothetical protein